MDSVRVDVWLWSVRQCKTRSLATSECKAGHVRINGVPLNQPVRSRLVTRCATVFKDSTAFLW